MAETIYIGDSIVDSETKVLFDESDFVDLVKQYMGSEAASYLENIINSNADAVIEAYENGVSNAWSQYDATEYSNGRDDGYEEGWANGYAEGYAQGFEEGYKKHNCWP